MTLVEPSVSIAALRAAHEELLVRLGEEGESDTVLQAIENFLVVSPRVGRHIELQAERRSAQAILDYWTTLLYRHNRKPGMVLLAPPDGAPVRRLDDDACPYPGLAPFSDDPRTPFFGRDAFVRRVVDRLATRSMVTLAGAAGCGRTSLLRAGLMPALRQGVSSNLPQGRAVMATIGPAPFRDLARAILNVTGRELDVETDALMRQPPRLRELLTTHHIQYLLVDQFEAVCLATPDERAVFLDSLSGLVNSVDVPCKVVLALLTENGAGPGPDFEPFLTEEARIDVPPPGSLELMAAIQYPADQVGLRFDEELVDQLARSLVVVPEPLPLLQFALVELWEHRDVDRIRRDTFRHLLWDRTRRRVSAGWALTQAAQRVLDDPTLDAQAVLNVLRALLRPLDGPELVAVRLRRSRLVGLVSDGERVVAALEAARVVRVDRSSRSRDPWVELTHVALALTLRPLQDAIDQKRLNDRARLSLSAAAELWRTSGQDPLLLWGGIALVEARRDFHDLTESEEQFLRASERQERWRHIRRRALVLGLPVVAILVLIWLLLSAEQGALAAHLTDQAELRARTQPDLALLLALHGYHINPAPNWDTLVRVSEMYPGLVDYRPDSVGITSVATSPTQPTVAYGRQDGSIILWTPSDARDSRAVTLPASDADRAPVVALAFSADGTELLALRRGASLLQRWSVDGLQPLSAVTLQGWSLGATLAYHDADLWAIALPPTAKVDAQLLIYNHDGPTRDVSLDRFKVDAMAFSKDGRRLAVAACSMVSGGCTAQLRVLDLDQPGSGGIAKPVFGDRFSSLAFSPDGAVVLGGRCRAWVDVANQCTQGEVLTFDVATALSSGPEPLNPSIIAHTDRVVGLGYLPESSKLVTASRESVLVWDTTLPTRQRLSPGEVVADCPPNCSPDGPKVTSIARGQSDEVAAGFDDGTATLWDANGKTIWTGNAESGRVAAVAVGGSETLLAIGASGTYLVEKQNDGSAARVALEPASTSPTTAVAFDDAATRVAVGRCIQMVQGGGCSGAQVQIWDVRARTPLGVPFTVSSVTAIAFSSDDPLLAIGQADGQITLWDTNTTQQLAAMRAHTDPVAKLAFEKDNLVSSDDKTSVRWSLGLRTLETRACRVAQSVPPDAENQILNLSDTGPASFILTRVIDEEPPCDLHPSDASDR
jgi:WD40 repeat protein